MNILYVNPGFKSMLESILTFQSEGETTYWSEPLFHFFPNLDQIKNQALSMDEKKDYLSEELGKVYQEQESIINPKSE